MSFAVQASHLAGEEPWFPRVARNAVEAEVLPGADTAQLGLAVAELNAFYLDMGKAEVLLLAFTPEVIGRERSSDHHVGKCALLAFREDSSAHRERQFVTTEELAVAMNVDLARRRRIIRVGERLAGHGIEPGCLQCCCGVLFK